MSKHSRSNESQNFDDVDRKLVASDDEMFSIDNNEKIEGKNINEPQGLISSQVIQECSSKPREPDGATGFFVANIPVVISEFEVEINCDTKIELDYPAVEIKRVKKNVFITQCRLLPKPKKLFLKGFIRKNIEYAAVKSRDSRGGNSIRHMTFEVPFVCTTEIDYFIPPVLNISSCSRDVEIYKSEPWETDIPEKSSETCEYFNEKIYCKPVMARVTEIDIIEENDKKKFMDDKIFKSLIEKITLTLRLKLLQNQDVNISSKLRKAYKKEKPENYSEEKEIIISSFDKKNQP